MFETSDVLLFVLPILFSVVSLAALHWFPWHSGARPLGRVAAYAAGTAGWWACLC
jgi:protein-S-isoprenylcysteine O-methyltransferase Ste14